MGKRGWGSDSSSLSAAVVEPAFGTSFLAAFRAKATSFTPSTSVTDLGLIVSLTAFANL